MKEGIKKKTFISLFNSKNKIKSNEESATDIKSLSPSRLTSGGVDLNFIK